LPELAKGYGKMTLRIATIVAVPLAGLIFFHGETIFRLYTNDAAVLEVLLPHLGLVTLW
jgi:Na+-driven multidrug efflux pump